MNFFYVIGFILIQFDSLPYIFKFSVYRPYFSIVFFFLYLLTKKEKITISNEMIIKIILVILFLNMINIINYFYYEDKQGLIKMLVSSIFGVITLISSSVYFKSFGNNKKRIINFGKLNYYSLFAPLIIGFLQLGYVFRLLPLNLNQKFFLLFSYRNLFDRVQFGGGEPSAGVRLVFIALICSWLYKKSKFIILVTVFLLIFTYSTYGYIYIILVVLGYIVLKQKFSLKKILKFIIVAMAILIAGIFMLKLFRVILPNEYMKNKIELILSLLKFDSFSSKLKNDGSSFQRLVNPIIGIIMGLKNPIFGVGSEYYYKNYLPIVTEYFKYALGFSSVAMGEVNGITPKNFFVKIFAENGIIIFILFLYLLKKVLNNTKKLKVEENQKNILYILYSATIFNWFTGQDSWMYVNNIIYLAFLMSLVRVKKQIKKINIKEEGMQL